jgi:acyl-CoA thioesterase YciA
MELISTHPIKKSDLGFHGNLFGGKLLAWMDAAAASYAMQVCDTPRMVTIKIDELIFKLPVKVNNIIKFYGRVEKFGNTSVTLYIEARKHNVYTGIQEIVTHTKMKFVRIDDEGNPIRISNRVKERYWKRLKQFGKGLLSTEERILEDETKNNPLNNNTLPYHKDFYL